MKLRSPQEIANKWALDSKDGEPGDLLFDAAIVAMQEYAEEVLDHVRIGLFNQIDARQNYEAIQITSEVIADLESPYFTGRLNTEILRDQIKAIP